MRRAVIVRKKEKTLHPPPPNLTSLIVAYKLKAFKAISLHGKRTAVFASKGGRNNALIAMPGLDKLNTSRRKGVIARSFGGK